MTEYVRFSLSTSSSASSWTLSWWPRGTRHLQMHLKWWPGSEPFVERHAFHHAWHLLWVMQRIAPVIEDSMASSHQNKQWSYWGFYRWKVPVLSSALVSHHQSHSAHLYCAGTMIWEVCVQGVERLSLDLTPVAAIAFLIFSVPPDRLERHCYSQMWSAVLSGLRVTPGYDRYLS